MALIANGCVGRILELCDIYTETSFFICRFGNIFGSNGSVVRLWLDALRRENATLRVTDPDMTRFMFSLEEAADTVDFALGAAATGDVIIPKMDAILAAAGEISALTPDNPIRLQWDSLHVWSTRLEGTVLILGLIVLYATACRFTSSQT